MNKTQKTLLATTFVSCLIGLLFVFEASTAESFVTFGTPYHFLKQQAIGLVIGFVALIIGYLLPSEFFIKTAIVWYVVGLLGLIAVFLPVIGLELNGAHRWIKLGSFTFQTVEFFKFAMIVFYAQWLSKHQKLRPFLFLTAIPLLLVILQPDLGSLLVVLSIAVGMFFMAGGNIKNLSVIFALLIPFLLIAIFSSDYRMKRLTTFIDPNSDPLGASFHIRQITLALGRGGLLGEGIGNSKQKFSYIPEASTDSIFSIIAEEIGFVGSLFIIGLFVTFFFSGMRLVNQANVKVATKLMGFGILIWIGIQVILNLSAVVALVPLTGIPLPFFSYGRSSLIMILFATGVLIKIGKQTEKTK